MTTSEGVKGSLSLERLVCPLWWASFKDIKLLCNGMLSPKHVDYDSAWHLWSGILLLLSLPSTTSMGSAAIHAACHMPSWWCWEIWYSSGHEGMQHLRCVAIITAMKMVGRVSHDVLAPVLSKPENCRATCNIKWYWLKHAMHIMQEGKDNG